MKQIAPLTKLHYQNKLFLPFENLIKFDQIRMIQHHRQGYFSEELLLPVFLLEDGGSLDNFSGSEQAPVFHFDFAD